MLLKKCDFMMCFFGWFLYRKKSASFFHNFFLRVWGSSWCRNLFDYVLSISCINVWHEYLQPIMPLEWRYFWTQFWYRKWCRLFDRKHIFWISWRFYWAFQEDVWSWCWSDDFPVWFDSWGRLQCWRVQRQVRSWATLITDDCSFAYALNS